MPPCWASSIGWKASSAPPVIADLLPEYLLQRMLDVWHFTGTNLLYSKVLELVDEIEVGSEAHRMVLSSLESDVIDRLEECRELWKKEAA